MRRLAAALLCCALSAPARAIRVGVEAEGRPEGLKTRQRKLSALDAEILKRGSQVGEDGLTSTARWLVLATAAGNLTPQAVNAGGQRIMTDLFEAEDKREGKSRMETGMAFVLSSKALGVVALFTGGQFWLMERNPAAPKARSLLTDLVDGTRQGKDSYEAFQAMKALVADVVRASPKRRERPWVHDGEKLLRVEAPELGMGILVRPNGELAHLIRMAPSVEERLGKPYEQWAAERQVRALNGGSKIRAVVSIIDIMTPIPRKKTLAGVEEWAEARTKSAATRAVQASSQVWVSLKDRLGASIDKASTWYFKTMDSAEDNLLEYLGVPPGQATFSRPTKDVAKVDMKLNWINFLDKKWTEVATDLVTIGTFANVRWSKATGAAAPQIATVINNGKVSFVDVPGVNSTGMPKESMEKLPSAIKLRPNETMAVCHSAGTDACAQSMLLTNRDKSQVFYLILSPRMAPSSYAEYMKKGNVPPLQVITINSTWDFPHKGNFSVFPENKFARALIPFSPTATTLFAAKKTVSILPDFWHDYEQVPNVGTHVMLVENYSSKSRITGLLHGSMYEGLTNGDRFRVIINGKHVVDRVTLPEVIETIRNGDYR